MTLTGTSCKFQVSEHLKTSKPGSAPTIIEIKAYTPDEKVCPMLEGSKSLTHYLSNKNRFDVSSEGPSSMLLSDVVIRYLHWPRIEVCPMLALQEYLRRTESLRGEHKQLFISYIKPYLYQEIPYQDGSKLSLMMPELTQAYTQHTVPGLLPHPKHTVMLFH